MKRNMLAKLENEHDLLLALIAKAYWQTRKKSVDYRGNDSDERLRWLEKGCFIFEAILEPYYREHIQEHATYQEIDDWSELIAEEADNARQDAD